MSLKPKRDALSLKMAMALGSLLVLFGNSEPIVLIWLLIVGLPCIALVVLAERHAAARARCIDRHAARPSLSERKISNHVR